MSEKMTRLTLPGAKSFTGMQDWGKCEIDQMIKQVRQYADHLRAQVHEIDAAADKDFQIDLVRGPYVQHFIKTIQASSRKDKSDERQAD